MHRYSVKAYYLAKMIADTPLLLVPAALYLLVMGFMSGLAASDTGCRFGMLYLGLVCREAVKRIPSARVALPRSPLMFADSTSALYSDSTSALYSRA